MTAVPKPQPPPMPRPAPGPGDPPPPPQPFRPRPLVARGMGKKLRRYKLHVSPRQVGATRTACGLFPIQDDTLAWYRAGEATCARCRQAFGLQPLPPEPQQLPIPGVGPAR